MDGFTDTCPPAPGRPALQQQAARGPAETQRPTSSCARSDNGTGRSAGWTRSEASAGGNFACTCRGYQRVAVAAWMTISV